jgi:xanthine dehydrogenase YagS FAD-binding subunit
LRKGGEICYAVVGDNRFHAILGGGPSYIAHPSDVAPALVALDVRIRIAGPNGEKVIPLEKFFVLPRVDFKRENILAPEEIVTEIQVPYPKTGARGFYHKVRERQAWDHAIVNVATVVTRRGDITGSAGWSGADPVARGHSRDFFARQEA